MEQLKCGLLHAVDQEQALAMAILDRTPFGLLRCNPKGRLVYCNRKACDSLGYTATELLVRTIFDIDPNLTGDDWTTLWQDLREGRRLTADTLHRRKDGSLIPVAVTGELIECNGRQHAVFFSDEMSERRRIEKELSLCRFSIDKAPFGIFRSGADGRILDVNDKACEYLGYSHAELCRMHITDIDPTVSIGMRDELWKEMCAKGAIDFETIHRRKDGTTFPVNVTCNCFNFGGSQYAISVARDLTHRKMADQQREAIEQRLHLAQRMESLGTLASGIAHDFNNILSAISGYAELAQIRCPANSKLWQYIDQIGTASIRAKDLIKQILTFSRQGHSEKRNIDISIVIGEALKLIQATLPPTIDIRPGIHPDLGDVLADETQIHQIVMNLCTNACQAMREQGGRLEIGLERVTVGTYDSDCYPVISPGNYVKLTVADTGVGIPTDILTRIFEPYFTTKPSSEGIGMGLSTVHGIVEDHGGGIKVNSFLGVGTTFQVFLPVAAPAKDQPTGKAANASILIVDDERLLLEIEREYLSDMGYAVEAMDDPIHAMEAIRTDPGKFDLVITDLTMPNMTGETLAREIKKILPAIPIILCTGFDCNCGLDRLKEMGISQLLAKPINLTELSGTISKLLVHPAA